MKGSHLSRKHNFLALAVVFISVAFPALCALCVAIDRRFGPNVAIIAAVEAGVVVAIFLPVFMRKPSRPANYPRIEHLRIAGKYAPTGASKTGISPLHLE